VAGVIRVAVPGSGLPLGTCTEGTLTVVEDGVGHDAAEAGDGGALEATGSGAPSVPASSVLRVLPAVTEGELALAAGLAVANGIGEGVNAVIVPDVPLRTLVTVITDASFSSGLSVLLTTECRGSLIGTRLSDKDKEEIQTSTRAVHILWVSQEQGWAVPEAPSWPLLRLLMIPCCLAEGSDAVAQGVLSSWAVVLAGERRAWLRVLAG